MKPQSVYRASCASRFSSQLEDAPAGRVLLLALEQPATVFARQPSRSATPALSIWDKATVDACRVLLGLDTLYASGERRRQPLPPSKAAKVPKRPSPDAVLSTNGRSVGRSFGFRGER